jgi:hypothetical protein
LNEATNLFWLCLREAAAFCCPALIRRGQTTFCLCSLKGCNARANSEGSLFFQNNQQINGIFFLAERQRWRVTHQAEAPASQKKAQALRKKGGATAPRYRKTAGFSAAPPDGA